MPGRPPKPTAIHIVQGTLRPDRHADRAREVQSDPGMPDPPDWLLPGALVMWGRIMSDSRYVMALRRSHWEMIVLYCQLYARWEEAEKSGKPLPIMHMVALSNLGAKLGRNPSDQAKVHVPEEVKPANGWEKLKAGSGA